MLLLSTETATATETKSENSPEDELEKRSEAEVKAVEREDAVDLSIKDHVDEVLKDAATNPVDQANKLKRAKTSPS